MCACMYVMAFEGFLFLFLHMSKYTHVIYYYGNDYSLFASNTNSV